MASMTSLENISVTHTEHLNKESDNSGNVVSSTQENTEISQKARIIKTTLLLLCMILLGFTSALPGTTFVDVEIYLGTDTSTLSFLFSIQGFGVIIGSFLCMFGGNRLSEEFTLGFLMCLCSIITMVALAVRSIYWMFGCSILIGFLFAVVVCELQPYLMNLWGNHRLKEPIIHSVHCLWALGLAIGPLFITPFLIKSIEEETPGIKDSNFLIGFNDSESNQHINNFTTGQEGLTQSNSQNSSTNSSNAEYSGFVMYAYPIVGLPMFIPSLLLIVYSLAKGNSVLRSRTKSKTEDQSVKNPMKSYSKRLHYTFAVLLLIFVYFYTIVELVPTSLLTLFATTFLGWKSPERTLINTAYFGFLTLGRCFGIVASAWLKQKTLLSINIALSVLASILLLFSSYSHIIVWLAASLLGFGISTIWAGIILWASESVAMTEKVMGLIVIFSSIGGMTGPMITGVLMDKLTGMWMVYIILGANIANLLTFSAMYVLEKKKIKKKKLLDSVKS